MFFLALASMNWTDPTIDKTFRDINLPSVTIQIPVFNESNVIERTILGITKLLYPREKLVIQILDDSLDETSSIIDSRVDKLVKEGYNFEIIRRTQRIGFKAGALANGLKSTDSEYVAIFDADFQIDPHFLKRTIHYFKNNKKIGAIQTRWEHTNLHYSIFTRSMSIGLDGHFLLEKMGRKRRNALISFNGTGGIWRCSVIDKSGGWSSKTLAEDLDLAYRAQINGYEILYLKNVTNSQEIPPTIRCWIIQQSRWAKGFSQNLRKNFIQFWRNSKGKSRIQGSLHLTQYFVPLLILVNTITGSILLYNVQFRGNYFFLFGIIFTLAAILGIFAYGVAIVRGKRPLYFLILIPLFLFWGAGLIVRMGISSIEGLLFKGGEFVKTPKFNLVDDEKNRKINIRKKIPLDKIFFTELVYIAVLILGIIRGFELGGEYIFTVGYYVFLLLSMLNMIFSEILHAFAYN